MNNFRRLTFFASAAGFLLLTACAQKSASLIGTQDDQSLENVRGIEAAEPAPVSTPTNVFTFVEQMPEFPGGNSAMYNFISKNMVYPSEAQENNEQGKVVVQFVVMNDGQVQDATVVRGVSPAIDKEALRIIKIMPRWQPGKQNGKPVNVRFVLPLTFSLN